MNRVLTEAGKKEIRETCVHFVGREPLSELMRFARKILLEAGMEENLIRVMDEQYVLNTLNNERLRRQVFGIFVLEDFSGALYEELCQRTTEDPKCRVIRPLVIIQARKSRIDVTIPVKTHPLMSLVLAHDKLIGITLSGDLSPEERVDLKRKILLMGGRAFPTVREKDTSMLVARTMSDSRSVVARSMKPVIPIVSPDWIKICYSESLRNNAVRGIDLYKRFLVPTFAGLTLSPAQIEKDLRKRLESIATESGFTYQPHLVLGETTHLICEKAEGNKWEAAQKWGVHCVSYKWVIDSVARGFALPENKYLIGPQSNYPLADSVSQVNFNETRFERKRSSKERRNDDDTDHLSHDTRKVSRSERARQMSSGPSHRLSSPTPDLYVSDAHQTQDDESPESTGTQNDSFTEKFSHLLDDRDEVFSGMEFFLVSCDAEKSSFFKRLIQVHSGYLRQRMSEDVSFVLVGKDELDEEAKSLMHDVQTNEWSAIFVNYKWLIESVQSGTLVDTDTFSFGQKRPADEVAGPSAPMFELPNLGFKVTKKDYSQRTGHKNLKKISLTGSFNDSIDDEDLLNEYGRKRDSTQTKSPAGGDGQSEIMSDDEDDEVSQFDNTNWKVMCGGLQDRASDESIIDVDDNGSIVSETSTVTHVPGRAFQSFGIGVNGTQNSQFRPKVMRQKTTHKMSANAPNRGGRDFSQRLI